MAITSWHGIRRRAVRLAVLALLSGAVCAATGVDASAQFNNLRAGYGDFARRPMVNVGPRIHYSPNINEPSGEPVVPCRPRLIKKLDNDPVDPGPGGSGKGGRVAKGGPKTPYIPNEVLILFTDNPSEESINQTARRYALTRLETRNLPLIGASLVRFRVAKGKSVPVTVDGIEVGGDVQFAQPNFRFHLQQAQAARTSAGGNPQYPPVKLRLSEAHTAATGRDVTVAVIDSGIDGGHPELAATVAESFDALSSREGPHAHGTGIAGAIAAHARIIGSAPAARILAVRAFGVAESGAESSTFSILKSLDYAAGRGARVINMSFAGPHDPLLQRAVTAADSRGIVLVAAAGNAGPKSPPLFPAAYREVIAVTATDASDALFDGANRGGYIAVAAPGVDVLLPSPGGKYQITTGTSFAAAYVSGVAALMIQRDPRITPAVMRDRLMATAQDLGPKGRDEQFGAGRVDAAAAVAAVGGLPVSAVSTGSQPR